MIPEWNHSNKDKQDEQDEYPRLLQKSGVFVVAAVETMNTPDICKSLGYSFAVAAIQTVNTPDFCKILSSSIDKDEQDEQEQDQQPQ